MTSKKHVARALPALPPRVDPQLRPLLAAIKEVLEVQVGHRGEDLDKAVTFRDLTESGIGMVPKKVLVDIVTFFVTPIHQTTVQESSLSQLSTPLSYFSMHAF